MYLALIVVFAVPAFAFQLSFSGPEVHSGRSVTFVLDAPRATHVTLWGDWMMNADGVPMERAESGWTLTTQPLETGLHLYSFFVDGLRAADPRNRRVKNGYPGLSSVVEVPAEKPAAPTGTTHIHHYANSDTGMRRTFRVYAPANLNRGTRLPVLYLLHGSSDSDRDWLELGRAAEILDDLVARRRAKPAILVMLDGHPYPSLDVSTRAPNLRLLATELDTIIMPLVERQYHPARRSEHRSIAGLSMGGVQALHLAAFFPGRFGTVAAFSAPGDVPDGPTLLQSWRAIPPKSAPQFRLWCGTSDPLYGEARLVHEQLRSLEFSSWWYDSPGRHDWMAWRLHLASLLEKILRP